MDGSIGREPSKTAKRAAGLSVTPSWSKFSKFSKFPKISAPLFLTFLYLSPNLTSGRRFPCLDTRNQPQNFHIWLQQVEFHLNSHFYLREGAAREQGVGKSQIADSLRMPRRVQFPKQGVPKTGGRSLSRSLHEACRETPAVDPCVGTSDPSINHAVIPRSRALSPLLKHRSSRGATRSDHAELPAINRRSNCLIGPKFLDLSC